LPVISEARCAGSGLRYLDLGHQFGGERRYFDADGGFVSVLHATDVIDAVCKGTFGWPVVSTCDGETDRKILCGTTWTAP
jgi:hypothetical protein